MTTITCLFVKPHAWRSFAPPPCINKSKKPFIVQKLMSANTR